MAGLVDRHRVADAGEDALAGRVLDAGVMPMTSPVLVEEAAAGVAGVDRRVRLDELALGPAAGAVVLGAAEAADETRGQGAFDAEGVADRDNEVADADLVRVADRGGRQLGVAGSRS